MGKISTVARNKYAEKVKEYKTQIESIQGQEKVMLKTLDQDEKRAPYQRLDLADESLNMVSFYLLMNQLSLTFLGVRNENMLNDARKRCYKAIIYIEQVVTDYIDVPFSEYEDRLELISDHSDIQKFNLVKKLGFSIESVKAGYGENTRWKWSFVEVEGRLAAVAKNLMNLKTFVSGMDPRVEGYETRMKYLAMVKGMFNNTATRYREKYEFSTFRIDDFKKAIQYLAALKRLNAMLGETDPNEDLKRKIDIWKTKMETDQRKQESADRKN